MGRTLDGLVLVDVGDDGIDFILGVSQAGKRHRHGVVHNLHEPTADQLLILDQRDVRLDAGRIAVHHEADGAGGREDGGLRVSIAELFAQVDRVAPGLASRREHVCLDMVRVDPLQRLTMLPHDAQERFSIGREAGKRSPLIAGNPG